MGTYDPNNPYNYNYGYQDTPAAQPNNGLQPLPVLDPKKPSDALGALSRRETERHKQFYLPVEQEAINSLNDTQIIEDAKRNANVGFANQPQRTARHLARYGVKQTGLQLDQAKLELGRARALNYDATVNNARLGQFERNMGLRNELINVGRGVASDATGALGEAAANETARNNANDAAKAAHKAQQTQMAGSLGAMAVMAAIMM